MPPCRVFRSGFIVCCLGPEGCGNRPFEFMKKLFYAGMTGLLLAAGTLTEAGPAMELRVGSGETVLEHYKDYGYNVII